MPYLASACGLSSTRTAGSELPLTSTSPTPVICDSFSSMHGVGRVVDLAARQRRRGERQDHDRRVGRVDLAIGRIAAQAGRQIGARGVDRRLDIARGAVDVAIEAELQGDARRADRARGGHLGHVGDLAEMALQRRCDGRSHHLRARAGHLRAHRDGREIDLRQRRDRQRVERDDPGERDAERQQRGGDGAAHEDRREAHCAGPSLGAGSSGSGSGK